MECNLIFLRMETLKCMTEVKVHNLLNGETRMERDCDGEAETIPQPIRYASWVSRRLDVNTNHPSYGESECNGGPSVNQFLMYRKSADPMCSYATPIDSNGLCLILKAI